MFSWIIELKDWMKEWTLSWVIENEEFTDHAVIALAAIGFIESSFFPIPADIPFIFMGITQPNASIYLATVLSISSVLGGAFGYWIGLIGGRPFVEWLVSKPFIRPIFSHEKFELVENYYKKYDAIAVLIAALTPIPYKVFTIGGGLCKINFWRFMLYSLIGRSARFFAVGFILYFWGEQAHFIIDRFDLFLLAMLVLMVLGFAAMGWMKMRKSSPPEETS